MGIDSIVTVQHSCMDQSEAALILGKRSLSNGDPG